MWRRVGASRVVVILCRVGAATTLATAFVVMQAAVVAWLLTLILLLAAFAVGVCAWIRRGVVRRDAAQPRDPTRGAGPP